MLHLVWEGVVKNFSALQRAEIAEIRGHSAADVNPLVISVLFNEPKLLKFRG